MAAAIVNGADFTTVSWTKTLCAATTAHEIICDNDTGTPQYHFVSQAAATSGLQANHSTQAVVDLKAGTTLTYVVCAVTVGYVAVNLTTGAATVPAGGGTVTIDSCVVSPNPTYAWRLTFTVAAAGETGIVSVCPATGMTMASRSFAATGTESILAEVVSVTQVNVSAFASQKDTNGAAVASPNDISTADWGPTGVASRTATSFTEDGGNTQHRVRQVTVPGLNTGRSAIVRVRVGTQKTWFMVYLQGTMIVVRDADGVVTATSGSPTGVSVTSAGGGKWDVVFTTGTTTDASLIVYGMGGAAVADSTYVGDGASVTTVEAIPGTGGIYVYQSIALTQATAANRLAVTDPTGAPWTSGRAQLRSDGVNDRAVCSIAAAVLAPAGSLTVCYCGKFLAAYAAIDAICDSVTSSGYRFQRTAAGQCSMTCTATGFNVTGLDELNTHAWCAVFNSNGTGYLYCDGVLKGSGALGVLTADGLTLADSGSTGRMAALSYDYFTLSGVAGTIELAQHAYYYGQRKGLVT